MDLSSSSSAQTRGNRPNPFTRPVSRLVERLLKHRLGALGSDAIRVVLPDGYSFVCGEGGSAPMPDWTLLKWNGLFRAISGGALGFGEGYLAGDWTSTDLQTLLTRLATGMDSMKAQPNKFSPSRWLARLRHKRNANTRKGSRRNIAYHYDLGNEFYRRWLDVSMTYSSAVFETPRESLLEAQQRKYREICRSLDLKPGDHVLEIGCGWGGFAEVAARDFGARVTGLTLSKEQLAYARDRMAAAGLSRQVDLRLQDYRDIDGQFDAIASIEMFEAVGEENWPAYFDTVQRVLKPGGRASLQIITIRERDFESYRRTADYIQKYIFPGGMLPTNDRLDALAIDAGLSVEGRFMHGLSYAATLDRWLRQFRKAWPQIREMGFDDRFDRMWQFYLAYCEAGFRTGRIDVGRFVYGKTG